MKFVLYKKNNLKLQVQIKTSDLKLICKQKFLEKVKTFCGGHLGG